MKCQIAKNDKLISEKGSITFYCFLSLGNEEQVLKSKRETHALATCPCEVCHIIRLVFMCVAPEWFFE